MRAQRTRPGITALRTPPGGGDAVCPKRTLLPQAEIEREVLDLLLQAVLTPATVGWLLQAVNARLRAQTDLSQPRLQELREALGRVDREIEHFVQAVGRGDFASLEGALKGAEARREVLRSEIEETERTRRGMLQLTPQALVRRIEGMVEKLRSGMTGRGREAMRASAEKILVGEDGSLTVEVKREGLLGTQTVVAASGDRWSGPMLERSIRSGTGRQWKVIGT